MCDGVCTGIIYSASSGHALGSNSMTLSSEVHRTCNYRRLFGRLERMGSTGAMGSGIAQDIAADSVKALRGAGPIGLVRERWPNLPLHRQRHMIRIE